MSFWREDPDISYAYTRLRSIYSAANALTTPREERFDFLLMACADLSRQYRKGGSNFYAIAVAQVFAWFMSLGEGFFVDEGGEIVARAMSEKYPKDHCGYCGKLPCECREEERAQHTLATVSLEQTGWSILRWQLHLGELYGDVNRRRGVPRVLNRLFEEVGEVGLILHHADGFNDPILELRQKIAREMADVLAWLFTTASLLGVNVQEAVRALYGAGCPVCHSPVCMCRSFEKRPQAGFLTHRFMPADEVQRALEVNLTAPI